MLSPLAAFITVYILTKRNQYATEVLVLENSQLVCISPDRLLTTISEVLAPNDLVLPASSELMISRRRLRLVRRLPLQLA